jgi:hypothetical protein
MTHRGRSLAIDVVSDGEEVSAVFDGLLPLLLRSIAVSSSLKALCCLLGSRVAGREHCVTSTELHIRHQLPIVIQCASFM